MRWIYVGNSTMGSAKVEEGYVRLVFVEGKSVLSEAKVCSKQKD